MKQILILFLFTSLNLSCKDKPQVLPEIIKFCWNITSQQLITIKTVCDKTAVEIATEYPDGCYYRNDEPLKCWFETSTNSFIKNCPVSLIIKVAPNRNFTMVDCNFCARWYYREKRKFLPNSSITYTPTSVTQLCGDTLATLYRGREVPLRQSADSIITRQFSDNGNDW